MPAQWPCQQQIETALARQLDLPDTLTSAIRTLELDRLAALAHSIVMALTNVLRNATQAVMGPAAVVRISAELRDDGRAVLFSIEDNGPGVPENDRQAIFEEGISLRPGGTGMGLALVRGVFEKEMRGMVDVSRSALGGARFAIRLPAAGTE